jgi:DNA invertase Pin-like site-specific DNA recombinase
VDAPKRVALYARVSTSDQTTENQLLDLRRYCSARGWQIAGPFVDSGISGAKKDRPALGQLMEAVRKRQVDGVLVWRFDRFARSSAHLVAALEEFRKRGVGFASCQEGIDTETPQGEFFFTIIAAMAQFERAIIIERINAGLRRARASGKRLGKPRLPRETVDAILSLRGAGSARYIAARVGVGKSVVAEVLSGKHTQNVASTTDETPVAFALSA